MVSERTPGSYLSKCKFNVWKINVLNITIENLSLGQKCHSIVGMCLNIKIPLIITLTSKIFCSMWALTEPR